MQINSVNNNLSSTMLSLSGAMERISSGMRINSAADDAAGLAISEKMRGQIRGTDMASRNAWDSISMMRTGEGALEQTHSNLQRMRELAVQAGNATYTDSDRAQLQAEVSQLRDEIDRIGNTTQFNTRNLLDGSMSGAGSATAQIGANAGQTAQISAGDSRSAALGIGDIDISTSAGAAAALEAIDAAIENVSSQRSAFGATENRFEHTIRNLDTSSVNMQSAQSRIRDADMAREIITMTTQNILRQASLAMTSQANMAAQGVLRLLG